MDTMEVPPKRELPKPDTFEGLSRYRPPLCYELVGKRFQLVLDDGYEYELEFPDKEVLTFGRIDGEKGEFKYDCLKPEAVTYFVNFEESRTSPRTGRTIILDLEQSLVTCVIANLGCDPKFPKMPSTKIVFGAIRREDGSVPTIRHGFTNELCGRAVDWNYGTFRIVHVYSSERYYRVTFTPKAIKVILSSNPDMRPPEEGSRSSHVYEDYADYIKVKDGVYVVNLLESILCRQRGHGNNLLFLMNLNEMHDVGRSFGTNNDGNDENYTFGAFGEYFDAKDTLEKTSNYHIR